MDLTTTYMGLKLKNPLVPSASPLDAMSQPLNGWKMLVLQQWSSNLFLKNRLYMKNLKWIIFCLREPKVLPKRPVIFRKPICIHFGPDEYLAHIRKCKEAVKIPIIASLNGVSTGGWTEYARNMQQAGADALELNSYYLATELNKCTNRKLKIIISRF